VTAAWGDSGKMWILLRRFCYRSRASFRISVIAPLRQTSRYRQAWIRH